MWAAALVFVLAISQSPEIVSAIQVHGNTATPDDEIRKLAGIEVGMRLEPSTIDDAAARLRATRKFDGVQVLKRFASIADPSQILLVVIVDEGPVKIEMTGDPDRPTTRIVRSRRLNVMFLPILNREDGYGFTYGVRIARPDVIGKQSRLSFPLTWGGEKRAGAEIEKILPRGPIDRVIAGASLTRRTNPFYEEDDDRTRVWIRGERELVRGVRAGATAGWQRASFFDADDRFTHAGADIVVDTRVDPFLARKAVYARAAWEHLTLGMNRTELDARGYVGALGQSVVAVRALRLDASAPLPLYLKPLLGGMANLRGFAAGTAAGDTLVATSAELIVPLTSPLNVGKIGVSAFVDAGTAYDKGARLSDQTLKQGYGGSLWFSAAFLRLNIAVAHGRGSSTRVHVGGNVSF
jgi:surface antigen Omp85-like protein/surface antigen-like variable number repeat protein